MLSLSQEAAGITHERRHPTFDTEKKKQNAATPYGKTGYGDVKSDFDMQTIILKYKHICWNKLDYWREWLPRLA